MKLSIIIPIYNSSRYLDRCLNSIIKQTFNDYEIIIVNDESSDNSIDIVNDFINKYPDKDIKLINIKHSGSSLARKKGLEKAGGEYIGFIDADDYINDKYYEILINEINDNDIIATDIKIGNNIKRNNYQDNIIDSKQASLLIFNQKAIYQYLVNKIYKKELFNNISFPKDMIGEDFIILLQLINNAKNIKMINNNLYYYDLNNLSQSKSPFNEKHLNMYEEFNKLLMNNKDKDDNYIKSLKRYILIHYMAILVSMSKNNTYDNKLIDKILIFIKENKDDYLKYSNDSLKAKIAVLIASKNYKLFNYITKLF